MDLFTIIVLCISGIMLVLLEIVLMPGVTFAAIGGIIFSVCGICHAFNYFGFYSGFLVLLLTTSLIILLTIYTVKSKIFNKISLNARIDSTLGIKKIAKISEGDEGVTLSRLNPIGKVQVNRIIMEGNSINQLIKENTPIIVLKVTPIQLTVKVKENV